MLSANSYAQLLKKQNNSEKPMYQHGETTNTTNNCSTIGAYMDLKEMLQMPYTCDHELTIEQMEEFDKLRTEYNEQLDELRSIYESKFMAILKEEPHEPTGYAHIGSTKVLY